MAASALSLLLLAAPASAGWARLNNDYVLLETNKTTGTTTMTSQNSNSLHYCRSSADCSFTETYGIQTYGGMGYIFQGTGEYMLTHWQSKYPERYASSMKDGKIDVCLKSGEDGSSYVEKVAFQCQDYLVFADASVYEKTGHAKLEYFMIDEGYLEKIDGHEAKSIEVTQAWANKKIFIKCKTSFDGMSHTLKLKYGDKKIDVSAFLVTRDVRGQVTNGLCQSYPGRGKFYKCGKWGTESISYDDAIEYPNAHGEGMAEFRRDGDGPNSCNANGWIYKIGKLSVYNVFRVFLNGILTAGQYHGEENFCPYTGDDGSHSMPTPCTKDLSSCSDMCDSYFLNHAIGY